MIDFNPKAKEIFEQNKAVGWWDDMNRCIYQTLQLINTEIAEATEGARKNLMDDHLPHRKMEEVELADVLIRTLDLGGRMGLEYHGHNDTFRANFIAHTGAWSDGRKHLYLVNLVGMFSRVVNELAPYDVVDESLSAHYTNIINGVLDFSIAKSYNVISAMEEKLAYNRERQDHKRENRKGEAGQKAF